MITILTMVIGFLTSALPSFLRYFEERQKLKYNVQIVSLQLEATLRNIDAIKEIEKIKQSIEDTNSARDHDINSGNNRVINFIRASVRPIVTYSFVFLYLSVKLLIFIVLWKEGINLQNIEIASKIILDDTNIAILGTILGFWFGSRVMFRT